MSLIILNVDEVRRTLSASGGNFVTHDKEVDIVRFAINSGFADIVLDGQVALRVMYQRPGETEVRAQTLTYYDTDGLRNYYDWQLAQSDLAKNGSLMVALCILDISGGEVSEWHTTPCAVRVLSTIHTDDSDEGDDTITPTVKERVAVLESMIQRVASGAPIVVSSTSAMTDTDQIYVLSTDGNWYYHNGSAWVAGGEYGAVATDRTLTQPGVPADAKATGNAIDKVKADLDDVVSTEYSSGEINKNSSILTFTESAYAGSYGYSSSQQYDSWAFTVDVNCNIYMQNIGTGSYMQMCVYPSGAFNDSNYVRYRNSDNNLPTQSNPLALTGGTLVIISTNKSNITWSFQLVGGIASKTLNQNIRLSNSQVNQVQDALGNPGYNLSYVDGILTVRGNGIDCVFSDSDFNNRHGVFELQNVTYNNAVIFGTNNDYLGPVRVHGEPIKGAKHGDEFTDVVTIIADGVMLSNGDTVTARALNIYVESTISTDEFKRYTIWALNDNKMTVSTVLKTLKDLQIDYVFGCGIISCQDDVNVAWINKQVLTTDVLIGLNENTAIVTTGGTLVSKRLSVNSDYGDHRVAFTMYSGRKKLYYYTCYGSNIAVPSGANFASCAELEFL